MKQDTVQKLLKLSTPRQFAKGECIFMEGDPGDEMYIVLQGSVGVYISGLLDESIQVATLKTGELFGEMALVDKKPRSASCVALEETICIAIADYNLGDMISTCPDVTENLLASFCARLREMNDRMYKLQDMGAVPEDLEFAIPEEHHAHDYWEPERETPYQIRIRTTTCPVCGEKITLPYVSTYELTIQEILPNQRRIYSEIDPLWHNISVCPQCGYLNDRSEFSSISPRQREDCARLIIETNRALKLRSADNASPFDALAFQYYQTIYLNKIFHPENVLLQAKLWMNLGWLYGDAGDTAMLHYCYEQALELYHAAYDRKERTLQSDSSRQQCAMIIAEIYRELGTFDMARRYYTEVISYEGQHMKRLAYDQMHEMHH